MKEDVAGIKEVKEEKDEAGSGNSSTDSVKYGFGPDCQINIPLG
jgi:hypothetical protein